VFARREPGIDACVSRIGDTWYVDIDTRHVARHVQIDAPGFVPLDDWFDLAPGTPAHVALVPLDDTRDRAAADTPPSVDIRAINAARTVRAAPAG